MNNHKANTIIDVVQSLIELKESGEILDLQIHWDEENNVLDIKTVPKQVTKFIQLDFTITPTGIEYN